MVKVTYLDHGIEFKMPNEDMYLGTKGSIYYFPYRANYYRTLEKYELYFLASRGVDKSILRTMLECMN